MGLEIPVTWTGPKILSGSLSWDSLTLFFPYYWSTKALFDVVDLNRMYLSDSLPTSCIGIKLLFDWYIQYIYKASYQYFETIHLIACYMSEKFFLCLYACICLFMWIIMCNKLPLCSSICSIFTIFKEHVIKRYLLAVPL